MFKLIYRKLLKNIKLYLGTLFTIITISMILGACLHLISGCVTSSFDGHRFDNCEMVVSVKDKVTIEYEDGDKTKYESEPLSESKVFSLQELNTFKEIVQHNDYVFDYTFPIKINKVNASLFGHNYFSIKLSNFSLSEGTMPQKNEVVIDINYANQNNLHLNDKVSILINDSEYDYVISGFVNHPNNQIYKLQNFAFFNDQEASQFANGIYNIGLFKYDEQLVKNLKNANFDVYTKNKVNHAEFKNLRLNFMSPMIVFITMGSICLLASFFVLFGTINFGIKYQQKEIALLRTIGMNKKQLSLMLIIENFIICLIGILIGLLLSIPFANLIKIIFISIGIIPENLFSLSYNSLMMILLVVGVLLLPTLISLIISHKMIKVSPIKLLKEEDYTPAKNKIIKIIFGLILLGGGVAVIFATPYYSGLGVGMGFCAVGLFIGASLLFTPLFMKYINLMLGIFTKRMYKSLGNIARANIKEKANKFAIAAISLTLMFSLNSVMLLNNLTYINDNAQNQYQFYQQANYYINNAYFDNSLSSYDYMTTYHFELIFQNKEKLIKAPTIAYDNNNLLTLDIVEGRMANNKNEIIILDNLFNINLNEQIKTFLPNGNEILLTVVGKYHYKYNYITESGIPYCITPYQTIKNNLFNCLNNKTYLNLTNNEYQDLVNKHYSLNENSLEAYKNSQEFDVQLSAIILMITISFMLTIIAIFNTFAMIISVRKKEFNCLRLIGANKKQIWKMTIIETIIVTTTGIVLGIIYSTICVGYFTYSSFGYFDFIVDPKLYFTMLSLVTICGLLGGIIPSYSTIKKIKQTYRNE